jgi:hypothetical protein
MPLTSSQYVVVVEEKPITKLTSLTYLDVSNVTATFGLDIANFERMFRFVQSKLQVV